MTVLDTLDGHPNEHEHAIIAEEVAKFLEKKGLLASRDNHSAQ